MKRKYILGLQPIKPTTRKEVYAVKVDGNLVIIWRWMDKKLTGLYAINAESGEHEVYQSGIWSKSKLAALKGEERYGAYYLSNGEGTYCGEVSEACKLLTSTNITCLRTMCHV